MTELSGKNVKVLNSKMILDGKYTVAQLEQRTTDSIITYWVDSYIGLPVHINKKQGGRDALDEYYSDYVRIVAAENVTAPALPQ
jgi:hypothetical protein